MPPKPAVRHRTLKRLINSENIDLEDNFNAINQTSTQESDRIISTTSKSIIPSTISETRIKQQQAINRELAERHKSFRMKKQQQDEDHNQAQSFNGTISTTNHPTINSFQDPLTSLIDPKSSEAVSSSNDNDSELDHKPQLDEEYFRPYPKKVFFIVANEFCERFSYYGLRTVLVLYFKHVLGYTDTSSTVLFHMFAALCYFTPILGAILGDSVFGKFHTILYLSVVYFLGELTLIISSIIWDSGRLAEITTFVGLLLIGLGTGGIKPCVSAFGGDQFLPNEVQRRQAFFSIFYASINMGSLISMFITPMLRSDLRCMNRSDCYPIAFGLPCTLMLISILVFLVGKNQYNRTQLPERNVIVSFSQCVFLALKRKLICYGARKRDVDDNAKNPMESDNSTPISNLSVASNDGVLIISNNKISDDGPKLGTKLPIRKQECESHWIYLASDRFDKSSLEDFRSVLGIMLLFVPIPVYWCLFDQQGSLWTLQAARMDGRIFNTDYHIQPDQITVANPLLLLATIPVFECVIYPIFRKFNMLTNPITRITIGGLIAAFAFVVSAGIELKIQAAMPSMVQSEGRGDILLVNGLDGCTLINTTISYIPIPNLEPNNHYNKSIGVKLDSLKSKITLSQLPPFGFQKASVISAKHEFLNNYKINFHLNNSKHCAFDSNQSFEILPGPLPDTATQIIYIEQGNGKLTYRSFDESGQLPTGDQARVRLLFESFGSIATASKRRFHLTLDTDHSSTRISNITGQQEQYWPRQFKFNYNRDGRVFTSDYIDVNVPVVGQNFKLVSSDEPSLTFYIDQEGIVLRPGTRNLIILHQVNSTHLMAKNNLILDNSYRISMLYQLIPYLMISVSEVMFSITGLEFSYSMAPSNMKSVILGAWCLTTAFGNLLTVMIEAIHPFSNVAWDFLFYASIMLLDMILFAFIGYNFKPHQSYTG